MPRSTPRWLAADAGPDSWQYEQEEAALQAAEDQKKKRTHSKGKRRSPSSRKSGNRNGGSDEDDDDAEDDDSAEEDVAEEEDHLDTPRQCMVLVGSRQFGLTPRPLVRLPETMLLSQVPQFFAQSSVNRSSLEYSQNSTSPRQASLIEGGDLGPSMLRSSLLGAQGSDRGGLKVPLPRPLKGYQRTTASRAQHTATVTHQQQEQ